MILTETRGYPVRLKDIGAARLGASTSATWCA